MYCLLKKKILVKIIGTVGPVEKIHYRHGHVQNTFNVVPRRALRLMPSV